MRFVKYTLILIWVLIGSANIVYSNNSPEDYLGVSLEISKKTQELVELKTQKVEASSIKEKIGVMGRIVQDSDNTIEVLAPQAGTLKECKVSLGSVVSKDQHLCTMETSTGETLEIKSPADGVIMAEFIEAKEAFDTVSPIYMLADLSQLIAAFDVYERDIEKVKSGQKVLLYMDAYPNKVFEGQIIFVSPRIDQASFTVKIRVQINNHEFLLKPGMFMRGEILVEDKAMHLAVPVDAIQNLDGLKVVFVQDEPESFTAVKVDMKLASHKQAFIDGDLKEGDQVVTDGSFMLKSKILEDQIAGGCSH